LYTHLDNKVFLKITRFSDVNQSYTHVASEIRFSHGCLETQRKTFTFTVRDSLVNICPLRDFAYGLRSNADPDASGLSKQSNYELVCGLDVVLSFSIPILLFGTAGIGDRFLKLLFGFSFKFGMP